MALTLVVGRANAGKSGVLHRKLERAARTGRPVLLLPARPEVARAEEEFAGKGVLGVYVGTFDDWIRRVWAIYGDGRRPVTASQRLVFASEAIGGDGADSLGPSGQTAGFARLVADVARRTPRPVDASTATARSLGRVVQRYLNILADNGYIESYQMCEALSGILPVDIGPVCVNRFTDFAPWQLDLLVELSSRHDVTVALTWEDGLPATEALTPVVQRLSAVPGCSVEIVSGGSWTAPALDRIVGGLYGAETAIDPADTLEFALATGAEAEATLAAEIVAKAIASGVRPGDIAVTFRDVASRANLLSTAFASRGVPAELDISTTLGQTSLGAALLALLSAVGGDPAFAREQLLAYVLGPYSGVSPEDASEADRRWRRRRMSGPELISDALRSMPSAACAIGCARDLWRRPLEQDASRKWKELLGELLASASARRGLGGLAGHLDAAAHRAALGVIGELADLPEGCRPGASEVIAALRDARVSLARPERPDAVTVTEVHRLRARRFDMVVVGGLTASEFSSERREPLAASLLTEMGQPSGSDERLSERMLFYTVVSRARRKLVLLRQDAKENGDAVRPSVFWEEVFDLLQGVDDGSGETSGPVIHRAASADVARTAPSFTPGRVEERVRARSASVSMRGRGELHDPAALAAMSERDEFSVSELEAYLKCPYRWFFERVVRPKTLDREVDALERGSRAHEILARFYGAWREAGHTRVTPEGLGEALRLLDEVAEAVHQEAHVTAIGLAEELSVARATEWARRIVEDDAVFLEGYAPFAHELRFGRRHDKPVEFAGVAFRGAIDRVERGPAGVLVIDYKSSEAKGRGSFVGSGLLQATVYAAIAGDITGLPVVGGVYRSMSTLKTRGFYRDGALELGSRGSTKDAVDGQAFEDELKRAAEAVQAAVQGIRSGHISPCPAKPEYCKSCVARAVCGGVL